MGNKPATTPRPCVVCGELLTGTHLQSSVGHFHFECDAGATRLFQQRMREKEQQNGEAYSDELERRAKIAEGLPRDAVSEKIREAGRKAEFNESTLEGNRLALHGQIRKEREPLEENVWLAGKALEQALKMDERAKKKLAQFDYVIDCALGRERELP